MRDLGLVGLSPAPADGQVGLLGYVPLILVFVVFWFLVLAPMRKRQKKHADMLQQLKAGDRVITNGGIYGTVKGIGDGVIQLKVAEQVTIEVAASAVASLQQPDA